MTESLSIQQARKLILLSQWLPWVKPQGTALAASLAALRHLGYIQIDTISVVERAHHHTLWNRSRRYQPEHLAQLLEEKSIFEYWSHAAAYLPIEDYRFSLPRMRAFADGARHWYPPDRSMMKQVRARICAEGALRTRDFAATTSGSVAVWDWKPAKKALERLFMEGELMTARRQGFDKVYDLAERVLPSYIDTRMPSTNEYARFAVRRFLQANGLGRTSEIAYLRSGMKAMVERSIADMAQQGEIVALKIKQRVYYALADSLALLAHPLSRKRLKILSPFDNLLIQRERMRYFFDFDYQIECYTPAHKRKHGYFSLPLLWDGKLVARMDCKAERATQTLVIRNLVSEPSVHKKEALAEALSKEIAHFAAFNRCTEIRVDNLHDKTIQHYLRQATVTAIE